LAVLATPTVSLTGAPSKAPFGSTFTLTAATNASTLAVITTNNAATCSLSGTSSPDMVTIIKGSSTCIFTATWAADNNYAAASTSAVTAAQKQMPVITWATPAAIPVGTALSATQLDASANVAGSFVYTPGLGTVLAAGLPTLSSTFTPTDTGDYATVITKVPLQVNVSTIVWAVPAAIIYGTPLSGTQLNATANVPGSFNYVPASGTVLKTGSHTLSAAFTPSDTTDYTSASAKVTLQVLQTTTTTTITSGSPTVTLNLSGVATASVAYNVTSYKPMGAVTLTASTG